jgi:protein-tyrosine-phosphatase
MGRGSSGTLRSRLHERLTLNGVPRFLNTGVEAARVLASARRRVRAAISLRRAQRARNNHAVAHAALLGATNVLIVCHGNIIRSPFAARYLEKSLGPGSGITVASAGLHATPGRPSPFAPVAAATTFQIDLRTHLAAPVTHQAVAEADAILVMDVPQLHKMRRRFPAARCKTFLLTCLALDASPEVQDPMSGGEDLCRAAFDHVVRAVRPIVAIMRRH